MNVTEFREFMKKSQSSMVTRDILYLTADTFLDVVVKEFSTNIFGLVSVGIRPGCSGGHVCLLVGGHVWLLMGGHAWLLRVGGVHGFFDEIRSMSGRYASHWNAFSLYFTFFNISHTFTPMVNYESISVHPRILSSSKKNIKELDLYRFNFVDVLDSIYNNKHRESTLRSNIRIIVLAY